tara:strand:- start:4666 stop:4926 length:261 start_codon:yes stop_codon:yes gene_type:complete
MAISRREKESDSKYSSAIGVRPTMENREAELEDVIEDLRDDVNELVDLANIIDGYTFSFVAAKGRGKAKLNIRHVSSGESFEISAK